MLVQCRPGLTQREKEEKGEKERSSSLRVGFSTSCSVRRNASAAMPSDAVSRIGHCREQRSYAFFC